MRQKNIFSTIPGHFIVLILSIVLTAISDQSPRVLLYAHTFSVLFRMITVWLFTKNLSASGSKGWMTRRCSREPHPWERSQPYKDSRTGKPAGIVPYVIAVLTLFFMLGIVQMIGSGAGFLKKEVLIPETIWAIIIAISYWVNDLYGRHLVISSTKSLPGNLGYNVGGLNFIMAAIFISAFLLVIIMQIAVWFMHGKTGGVIFMAEWILFIMLTVIRFISDVLRDLKKKKGSFKKLSQGYKGIDQ